MFFFVGHKNTGQTDDGNCHVSNFVLFVGKGLFEACSAVLGLRSTLNRKHSGNSTFFKISFFFRREEHSRS
jgi:hypothetical protein